MGHDFIKNLELIFKMAKTKKYGKIGAPKSAKRKAWLKSIRKKRGK